MSLICTSLQLQAAPHLPPHTASLAWFLTQDPVASHCPASPTTQSTTRGTCNNATMVI